MANDFKVRFYSGIGARGPQGPKGDKGDTGATGQRGPIGPHYTPDVSTNGDLTWTNDGGLVNPDPVNLTDKFVNTVDAARASVGALDTDIASLRANVSDLSSVISQAQAAVDGIEDQRDEIMESIAEAAELGTDTTLSTPGMAADAQATGNRISTIENAAISDLNSEGLWTQGGMTAATARENAGDTRIRTSVIPANIYKLVLDENYGVGVFGFSGDTYVGEWQGTSFAKAGKWFTGAIDLSEIPVGYSYRLVLRRSDDSAIAPSDYAHIKLLNIPMDSTLEREDLPANAKAVSDAIAAIPQVSTNGLLTEEAFVDTMPQMTMQYFPEWALQRRLDETGTDVWARGFCTSGQFTIGSKTLIKNESPDIDSSGKTFDVWLHEYGNGVWLRRTKLISGELYSVQDDADSAVFVAGYPNSEDVSITQALLAANFKVRMSINSADWVLPTKRPLLVAFGASTTTGAIHHFTGDGTTQTLYKFPQYIANKLHMDCVNLGVGTTGFVARASNDRQNFMDRIYNNDATLQNADVVILMFGYGNDYTAGLPIGAFDDYYPYDEVGYHPTGSAAVPTLIAKGATLMGCLNWCIKWINENYPKAQLIPIFSAPSANKDRTWTLTAQTEGEGIAPYKLTFNDPYDTAMGTEANIGIKQISAELQKLKEAANIQIIDQFFDGNVFSPYQTYARNADGTYALFSTTGPEADPTEWTWNSHPNDAGYALYARWLAGKIGAIYGYRY